MRLIDLETKAYANSSRPATLSRNICVEELTSQLHAAGRSEASKLMKDARFQQAESDRHRAKFEEERRRYKGEVQHLRQQMDTSVRSNAQKENRLTLCNSKQTQESDIQAAQRRGV